MIKFNKWFFLLFFTFYFLPFTFAEECSPYFNPNKFYDAPEYLQKLLADINFNKQKDKFNIEQKELYRFKDIDIANDINENFGGFWSDWIEDGYEMQLTPEHTLFKYNNFYFSLSVFIYGVVGDATKLKATTVKYYFYNYTTEVNKYMKCKKDTIQI